MKSNHSFSSSSIFLSLAITLLFTTSLNAQKEVVKAKFLQRQKRGIFTGISMGYHQGDYLVSRSEMVPANLLNSISGVTGMQSMGFNLNLIGNIRLNNRLDLRLFPGFSFEQCSVQYDPAIHSVGSDFRVPTYSSVYFDLPIQLRYTLTPRCKSPLYLMGGYKYQYDMESYKRAPYLQLLTPTDGVLEGGVGIKFICPYFMFCPELKFSQGLWNRANSNSYSPAAASYEVIHTRVVTLSLIFEG